MLGQVNGVLLGVAVAVGLPSALWWWHTRHPRESSQDSDAASERDVGA